MLSDSNKIRLRNTLSIAQIILVVLLCALYFDVPGNVLIFKVLVVPIFWFSLLGLRALYRDPIEGQAVFSSNVIEYNILFVFAIAVFVLIVCWTPALELSKIIGAIAIALLFGLPLRLYLHRRYQEKYFI